MNTNLQKIGELLAQRLRYAVDSAKINTQTVFHFGNHCFLDANHHPDFFLCQSFVFSALGQKKADKNLIDYVMTVIVEFARRHDLTIREASNYIRRFKGIDFLTEFYDVEHTLSFNDCVDDLTIVCQNNGGTLR